MQASIGILLLSPRKEGPHSGIKCICKLLFSPYTVLSVPHYRSIKKQNWYFHMKLLELINDIEKESAFGPHIYGYTINPI
jgi:hypothetical protein